MNNFKVSNQAFNNALNRVSNLTDEQAIAHGLVEQLLNKNLNRLYLINDKLVTKDGKPNALAKKISAYLKHMGFKANKNKQGQIKVKQWIESDNLITFAEFLAIEKEGKPSEKTPLNSRLFSLMKKELKDAELSVILEQLELAKSELLAFAMEQVKTDKAIEFDIQCADIEGKKKTKAA